MLLDVYQMTFFLCFIIQIQWEVDDGDGSGNFTKYAPELNLKIETAHENKENKVSWTAKGVELTIDLKRSVLTSPLLKTPHKVKRRGEKTSHFRCSSVSNIDE